MALDNYENLKAAVAEWCMRNGDAAFAAQADTFLQLAETEIDLALTGFRKELTGTISMDGDGNGSLPAGFTAFKSLTFNGHPVAYTLSGTNVVAPRARNLTLDAVWLSKFAGLSASNQTNWLLQDLPNAYLFMTMAMGEAFNKKFDQAATLNTKALQLISAYSQRSLAAQYGQASLKLSGAV